ncbi:hypothetical protein Hanom_Chr02g00149841 [Helianthus anomalus]
MVLQRDLIVFNLHPYVKWAEEYSGVDLDEFVNVAYLSINPDSKFPIKLYRYIKV